MKWIHEEHGPRPSSIEGVEPMKGYITEGWLIETEDDKDNFILCKRCGNKTPIKECKERDWGFMDGDEPPFPIWYLECPSCSYLVGRLVEQNISTGKVLSQRIVGGRVFKHFEKKTRLLLEIYDNESAEVILK